MARLVALVVATLLLAKPVIADSWSDLERCKFVGELAKADKNIEACDRAIADPKISPRSRVAALSNRCGWWWTKHQPQRALSDCNEAIRLDPAYAVAYLNRGNAYMNDGDFERALEDLNEAIRIDPQNAWAYTSRGDLYKRKRDFDHALGDFNKATQLEPNYALAFFERGLLQKARGDFDQALLDFNVSVRLDDGYAPAYFNRGLVYYIMGNNLRAIDDFTRSVTMDPKDASAYFNRGVALFLIGNRAADAAADFKKANELIPKNAYFVLWLDIAERRTGSPRQLRRTAAQVDSTVWPGPLLRQFLGELTYSQTLAPDGTDPTTSDGKFCEANFYSGELMLANGEKQEAFRLLRLAAKDCPQSFIEGSAAIVELIVQR